MTIKIKNLTVRNFMSVGAQTQALDFDKGQLTLVLGENLDLGGDDSGARNGTGKTTIINGLSYAIYGTALTNIKRDNLVNKINGKAMLCTVTFEKNGTEYHIERGRKPNFLKFSVNGQEQAQIDQDESQGDSRETQKTIEDVFGMTHEMFKHLVALNTYTEPFLAMKAADQRSIIEQLLGITLLSEKAETLKDQIKFSKDEIATEHTKIETIKISNEKIQQSIQALERKQKMWNDNTAAAVNDLEMSIQHLKKINIEAEIAAHKCWDDYNKKKTRKDAAEKWIANITADNEKQEKFIAKLKKEIESLLAHKCYACGQDVHDAKQTEIMSQKTEMLQDAALQILTNQTQEQEHQDTLKEIGQLEACPVTQYDTIEQAYNHRSTVEGLQKDLVAKQAEANPYTEQILELSHTALQELDWNMINELTKVKDHQEFLYKLLTNKDSFVRKRIIDQNLAFLNQRLTYYLDRIGLPHIVEFQNDLTVTITQLGQDLDFDNLSRGERNRLILSLSWAFRDVWENLYHPINLLFIDELVDSGMDASGVESSIAVLKKMTRERNKNVFLISHRDDLTSRVNHVLKVIKENGFTSYSTDIDIIE
jgi:energy-coupling factor transporter ATP-binding protein EcfA2